MATKISVQKGANSLLTVVVSYGMALGAAALVNVCGIDIPKDTQTQIVVCVTAGLSGAITGTLNWLKHRKNKPSIVK
ncbi:hypothetical protein CCP2SC5_920001 [Azospirillaceae bacterium]